ncbi:LCP family protein [Candidatus Peregrinibacteria bacterium]|nr:LCP family protein [Candidatus Peregrinibacteria bacterium]
MDFKTRRIRYRREKNPWWMKNKHKVAVAGVIFAVIILFFYGCAALIQRIGFINIIGIFGEPLSEDQYGTTNILMLGIGGGTHDGADLTDTIILASIDKKNKFVPMLSIPRDFYVDIKDLGGRMRINSVYEAGKHKLNSEQGIQYLITEVEKVSGVKVHYYVKIDFSGFKDIVDALDGVDIYVDEAINDPYYPLDGTILYSPFYLAAGQQHMDGETALKYARSRKTTSDFDRSKRQQKLLFAIKNKAMTKEILLDPGKITALYNSVSANMETNLSIRQIIELAKISQDFDEQSIITRVINDNPLACGGFLYTPDRSYFNNAAVLVPIGSGLDFIHQYIDLIFHYPDIHKNPVKIQVLNGTKAAGLASEGKAQLRRLCFDVVRFGNARNQEIKETTIYYKDAENPPAAIYFIQQIIPGKISSEISEEYFDPAYESEADIIIELGEDYAENKPDDIFYYYYPIAQPTAPTNTTTTEDEADQQGQPTAAEPTEGISEGPTE